MVGFRPHSHWQTVDLSRLYLCRLARHGPWLDWQHFSRDHIWWGTVGCRLPGRYSWWQKLTASLFFTVHCVDRCHIWHIRHWDASCRSECWKSVGQRRWQMKKFWYVPMKLEAWFGAWSTDGLAILSGMTTCSITLLKGKCWARLFGVGKWWSYCMMWWKGEIMDSWKI